MLPARFVRQALQVFRRPGLKHERGDQNRMSTGQTLALGAVAGFTIFLGLPLGRVRSTDVRLRAGLRALAGGVLLSLLWAPLSHGVEPVGKAHEKAADGGGS